MTATEKYRIDSEQLNQREPASFDQIADFDPDWATEQVKEFAGQNWALWIRGGADAMNALRRNWKDFSREAARLWWAEADRADKLAVLGLGTM